MAIKDRTKIRLQDVADLAAVSLFSASKVVNGSWRAARISEPCAERILAAAKQLGYAPNYHAQSLMRGRAGAIGLVLRAPRHNDVLYAAELVGGMEAALSKHQLDLLIIGRRGPRSEIQHALESLRQHRVDALVVPGGLGDEAWDEAIEDAEGPVVLATARRGSRLPTVDVDPAVGIEAAVAHLRELGHRALLWMAPTSADPGDHVAARTTLVHRVARASGMRLTEARFDAAASLIDAVGLSAQARQRFAALARDDLPSAVLCYNDTVAVGVLQAAHQLGLQVPAALSVVGFDDFRGDLAVPRLTTISHRLADIAERAAERAISLIEEPSARAVRALQLDSIPARLVVRESTAPPAQRTAVTGGGPRGGRSTLSALLALLGMLALSSAPAQALDDIPSTQALTADWRARVHPLLEHYCIDCHDQGTKSDLRLDTLAPDVGEGTVASWTRVKNMLDVGAMPPAGKDRPNAAELDLLLGWINGSLARFASDARDLGGDTLLRRINNRAYANMLHTLLGVPAMGIADFPADGTVQGYDTVGAGLYTNAGLYGRYFDCARATIELAMPAQAPPNKPSVNTRTFSDTKGHNFERERKILDGEIAGLKHHPTSVDSIREIMSMMDGVYVPPSLRHLLAPHLAQDAIAKHYGCESMEVVNRKWQGRKTSWTGDMALVDPLITALETMRDQLTAIEPYVSPYQPVVSQWPGYIEQMAVTTTTAGCYEFSAHVCLLNPAYPLPVGIYMNGALAKQVTLYGDLAHSQTVTLRAWCPSGTTVFSVQSALPNAIYTASHAWFHFFIDYVMARFGITEPQAGRATRLFASFHFLVGPEQDRAQDAADPLYYLPAILCDRIALAGPLVDTWPTPAEATIFNGGPTAKPSRAYAESVIIAFMRRAYASPDLGAATATPYVDLVMQQQAAGTDFKAAVKFSLAAILCSPRFLYLDEHARTHAAAREPLAPRELARRLAYVLWSDLPDDELMNAAMGGTLADNTALAAQVTRMLKDPRSHAFREAFATQWLRIDHLEDIPFSFELLPTFSIVLLQDAKRESVAFFSEVLDHNLSVANFIDSDFAMLNGTMAVHYGIPGVSGDEFRRVSLPTDSHRGGVLGQASVLMATSNGMVQSLVKRGVFIMDRLLGLPPGHPPPNVPALDKVKSALDPSLPIAPRELMAMHRHTISCARCHDKIDPLGIALEQYDALGCWRQDLHIFLSVPDKKTHAQWASLPADVHGALPDGEAFSGPDELKRLMLAHQDRFTRCLAENLAVYALGRELQASDRPALDRICAAVAADHGGLATMVQSLVASELFRTK